MNAATIRTSRILDDVRKSGLSLVDAIARGTATTGLLYLPPLKPKRYKRPLNADLVAVGGDMRRAVEAHEHGQEAQAVTGT